MGFKLDSSDPPDVSQVLPGDPGLFLFSVNSANNGLAPGLQTLGAALDGGVVTVSVQSQSLAAVPEPASGALLVGGLLLLGVLVLARGAPE